MLQYSHDCHNYSYTCDPPATAFSFPTAIMPATYDGHDVVEQLVAFSFPSANARHRHEDTWTRSNPVRLSAFPLASCIGTRGIIIGVERPIGSDIGLLGWASLSGKVALRPKNNFDNFPSEPSDLAWRSVLAGLGCHPRKRRK